MRPFKLLSLLLLASANPLLTQTLGNGALVGKYYFRHVLLVADSAGALSQASSLAGSMTFDGQGRFTFQGQQTVGTAAPAALSGSGTYAVRANGLSTLTNPQRSDLVINARLGSGFLLGSSTEATGTVLDLLLGFPAPTPATPVSNSTLNGAYQVATLEFPSGVAAQARCASFSWTANGAGSLGNLNVTGHAANINSGLSTTQTVSAATYTIATDGSGTATFGSSAGTQLLSGGRTIYVSADGNLVLGGSTAAGGHDFLIAVKALSGTAANSSLQGVFFTAGLALGSQGLWSYAGSANSAGKGSILFDRRYHAPAATVDFTGVSAYALNADGTGVSQLLKVAVGAGGQAFFNVGVNDLDASNYELDFAIRTPAFSGSGVYLNPIGVVNAGSLAPVGSPVAPGEYISLFGAGLAAQAAGATSLPLPTLLGAVTVTVNGIAAPLNYVSATQINALVPFGLTGTTATIVVRNGTTSSNSVDVPLAATAPGVFSQDSSGAGPGAVLHADFSLVNAAKPARRGETVLIYLTGLGATSPPVTAGGAGPSNPLSTVTANVTVLVGGKVGAVLFKGLAPGFAGLYQLNVTIPADALTGTNVALAISTSEAFHDQVDIAVQ